MQHHFFLKIKKIMVAIIVLSSMIFIGSNISILFLPNPPFPTNPPINETNTFEISAGRTQQDLLPAEEGEDYDGGIEY